MTWPEENNQQQGGEQTPPPGYGSGPTGNATGNKNGFDIIVSPLLSFFLFTSAFIVPIIGPVLNVFAPLPLIYYFYTHGRQPAYIAAIGISIAVGLFFGMPQGGAYLLGYGLVAIIIAEMLLRHDSMNQTLAMATAIPLMLTTLFVGVMIVGSGADVTELYGRMHAGIAQMLTEMTNSYRQSGMDPAQLDQLTEAIPDMAHWVLTLLPGAVTIFFMIVSAGNYFGFRRLQDRYGIGPGTEEPPFRHWSPPEQSVFLLIGGAALAFLTGGGLQVAGANLLLVMTAIYCLGGVAILQHFLDRFKTPFLLRLLAYSIIMVQPVFLASVAGFGLFDIWFDFRKLRKGGPTDGNPEEADTEKD